MKRFSPLLLTLFLASTTLQAETGSTQHLLPPAKETSATQTLTQWKAGTRVSEQAVKAFGLDKCFSIHKIDDATFKRIHGKSFPANCRIPRADLRYLCLLHRTLDGHIQLGELICHRRIANDLVTIFRQLYDARYPIERMVLIDNYGAEDEPSMTANNTSCFCYRTVAGSQKLSAHSMGLAVDINPLYNPCIKTRNGKTKIQPKAGHPYIDRNGSHPYKITHSDLCFRLFRQHGFTWGGDWRSLKDYQHFEKAK